MRGHVRVRTSPPVIRRQAPDQQNKRQSNNWNAMADEEERVKAEKLAAAKKRVCL